ncbi:MAG TPA: STAS domain-containing protein [Phycisphaerae bacterium]|jgi:anti-anti-sigma factor|nr:STAS domain-containing protein [Phycisphaerae bacterium]
MLTLTPPRYTPSKSWTNEAAMSAADLHIEILPGKESLTVSLAGEANFGFDKADEHITRILSHKSDRIVIDASKLTFISSVGMCFLINLRKAVKETGGSLKIASLQPLVRKAMEHAHVIHLFEVQSE